VFDELCRRQHGVIGRSQALACGLTDKTIESRLRHRRWQRIHQGVYATFTGSPTRLSLLWAAVLRAGPGSVVSHETAAELAGLADALDVAAPIHVTIPTKRKVGRVPSLVVHRSSRVEVARYPTRLPPQTRIEETVIDLTQSARVLEQAMSWISRAVGARLTTPERLGATLAGRRKVKRRKDLAEALHDVAMGCHSVLELRYLRGVERVHGLPEANRQTPSDRHGGKIYDDVLYEEYHTVVELDGRAAHPDAERWRDMRRDNGSVVDGRSVLRYGRGDVCERPCHAAHQVARVLQANGWTGAPTRCHRADCVIAETPTPDRGEDPPRSHRRRAHVRR